LKQIKYISVKSLILFIDFISINGAIYLVSDSMYFNFPFLSYISIFWFFIAHYTNFYDVHRYTHYTRLIKLLLSQFFVFGLAFLSYFTLFREGEIISNQSLIFILIFSFVSFFKFFIFYVQKKYRNKNKDFKKIVLFGDINSAEKLELLFNDRNNFGYEFYGFFSRKEYDSKKYLGPMKEGFNFVVENKIEEIYCDPAHFSDRYLIKVRQFSEKFDIELKFLPESKAIYSKDFTLEYLGTVPVLKPKPLPFEKIETHFIKRVFDLIFSLSVCILVLSWLIPILWIIVKSESKGPLFFKQKRDGLDGKQFYCYKIRSMVVNDEADKISATKNDPRITKIGAFLRKSSIDELPQFFNVLFGNMSVVGPRPHINVQNEKYANEIDNYLLRNSVKPGITGLAQISGFRGEVTKKSDIKNRVRLDVFYIENWSFFLDVKIVVKTFLNFFNREEKAY